MALVLNSKYQINTLGTILYVTDISGEYNATTNVGGWGTPNSQLSQSALIAVVQRVVGTAKTSLAPISNQVVYNPSAVNTDQTQFTFTIVADGHLEMTLLRLPVSLDGSNTVESTTLNEGDFFYWNSGGNLIWKIVSGVPVVKTPEDILEEVSVTQTLCEDLIFPKLAIKYNSLYRTYIEERDSDCNNSDVLFKELVRLRLDLYGAKSLFRSGLKTKAEQVIDTLLKKYDLAV